MKVRYWISTNKQGSECSDIVEFDDDEWSAMTEDEQEAAMKESAFNHLDWGYETVD